MAATYTPNLNLAKPDRQDFVSVVADINENMDKLDQAYGDMSTFRTIPFTINPADWTSSGGNYVYELSSAYISATSKEVCVPNADYANCNAHIIITKSAGNDGVVFTADALPSAAIGGEFYVLDKDDHKIPILLQGTVVPVENGGSGQSTLAGTKNVFGITNLENSVQSLSDQIGTLNSNIGTLSSLTTTAKTSAVVAINEVNGKIANINQIFYVYVEGSPWLYFKDTENNTYRIQATLIT